MIVIRRYQAGDEPYLRELLFHTIRHINIAHYSPEQVQAWAPEEYDEDEWRQRISAINPFIALIDNKIVGYADVQDDGYIDHFFCHWQYQGKGVGRTLVNTLLNQAKELDLSRLYTHASITAKPFFMHFGFDLVKEQQVNIREQVLTNYVLEKQL